jgi:hypothetical protein
MIIWSILSLRLNFPGEVIMNLLPSLKRRLNSIFVVFGQLRCQLMRSVCPACLRSRSAASYNWFILAAARTDFARSDRWTSA